MRRPVVVRSILLLACVVAPAWRCTAANGEDSAPAGVAPRDDAAPTRGKVPPVPEGSPADLLAYIEQLGDPALAPESRGRQRYHRRKCLANTVEAADRILAQVPVGDPAHGEALHLKFTALEQLDRLGEPRAAEALAAFAGQLAAGPDQELAVKARAVSARVEADALVAAGRLDGAPAMIHRLAGLLEAAPDDVALAEAAASFAAKLERAPGGEAAAREAYETFVPLFEASGSDRIARLAGPLAGKLRLLSLPGKPMPIEGRLLDGADFDQASLAGKVVLVDFWATWCGPCVAEIANIRVEYDRYHDRGFEVLGISLDDDRAALERFAADRDIPWPVIVDAAAAAAGGQRMADRYGITGIPQCILIGADGTVISTTARGRRLGALLAEQFPDAPGE